MKHNKRRVINSLKETKPFDAPQMKRLKLIASVLLNKICSLESSKILQSHDHRFLRQVLEVFSSNYEFNGPEFYTFKMTMVIALGQAYELKGKARAVAIDRIISQVDSLGIEYGINSNTRSDDDKERLKIVPISGRGKRIGLRFAIENIHYLFDHYSKSSFERDCIRFHNHEIERSQHFASDFEIHEMACFVLKLMFGFDKDFIARFTAWTKQNLVWDQDPDWFPNERPINNGAAAEKRLGEIQNEEDVRKNLRHKLRKKIPTHRLP